MPRGYRQTACPAPQYPATGLNSAPLPTRTRVSGQFLQSAPAWARPAQRPWTFTGPELARQVSLPTAGGRLESSSRATAANVLPSNTRRTARALKLSRDLRRVRLRRAVGAWLTLDRGSFKSPSGQPLIACDSGLPSVVIWFRMRHARLASTSRPPTLRAPSPSPMIDLSGGRRSRRAPARDLLPLMPPERFHIRERLLPARAPSVGLD
ncbi:hypothetical protein LuPra_02820 [Luteitalea pratensis]|uniref:Uncharacterized protein n=1 Tax=Luteitalea pratensis TaxID=1855912 RepID=A0A143PM76_LUTPR|nr:hypothetical protein LuPra_02820 [Luteitalea pratensis]